MGEQLHLIDVVKTVKPLKKKYNTPTWSLWSYCYWSAILHPTPWLVWYDHSHQNSVWNYSKPTNNRPYMNWISITGNKIWNNSIFTNNFTSYPQWTTHASYVSLKVYYVMFKQFIRPSEFDNWCNIISIRSPYLFSKIVFYQVEKDWKKIYREILEERRMQITCKSIRWNGD